MRDGREMEGEVVKSGDESPGTRMLGNIKSRIMGNHTS